jgi:tetrahydromethanopterin S-methyltransferase subunit C
MATGVVIALAGIYVGETDDAPGAALIGFLLMSAAVFLGVKIMRRKT